MQDALYCDISIVLYLNTRIKRYRINDKVMLMLFDLFVYNLSTKVMTYLDY